MTKPKKTLAQEVIEKARRRQRKQLVDELVDRLVPKKKKS